MDVGVTVGVKMDVGVTVGFGVGLTVEMSDGVAGGVITRTGFGVTARVGIGFNNGVKSGFFAEMGAVEVILLLRLYLEGSTNESTDILAVRIMMQVSKARAKEVLTDLLISENWETNAVTSV